MNDDLSKMEVDTIEYWRTMFLSGLKQQTLIDEKEREAPDLRVLMVKLCGEIGQLIDEYAERLQHERSEGDTDPFEVDALRDVIAWQVVEFASQGRLTRNDESYRASVKGHQWTHAHAAHWFETDLTVTGDEPVIAEESEAEHDDLSQ